MEALERAAVATVNAWHKLPECPGDMYVREARELARAAVTAFLEDEAHVERVARAINPVAFAQDAYAPYRGGMRDKAVYRARAAIAALRDALMSQDKGTEEASDD